MAENHESDFEMSQTQKKRSENVYISQELYLTFVDVTKDQVPSDSSLFTYISPILV